jgi:2-(1,2-epoxy-1,2-dihydrophenyl)acetyl-CoA isomerase
MDTATPIVYEQRGAVAKIVLNRPNAANGLNEAMMEDLACAAARCDADPKIRSVVLTGTGHFFCGGGDLKAMHSYGDHTAYRVKRLADLAHRAISTFARMRAPVIVAVNGMAAGGGFALAMSGDIVVAAESARFTMAYTAAGLSPDGSSTYYLPRLIGLRRTQELAYLNRVLTAQEALGWGLVTQVVADTRLVEHALSLAERVARGPASAHGAVKRLLVDSGTTSLETQMELEGRLISQSAASPDGREGVAAFLEKRPPRFG